MPIGTNNLSKTDQSWGWVSAPRQRTALQRFTDCPRRPRHI